jgi:hypothetical protein
MTARTRRAPVLIGAFDPMRRQDDAWLVGVRDAVRAINRTGKRCRLTYRPTECRPNFRWKYRKHRRRLRAEDAVSVEVYLS